MLKTFDKYEEECMLISPETAVPIGIESRYFGLYVKSTKIEPESKYPGLYNYEKVYKEDETY